MKKNVITNWAKYFAGVCAVSGMLLVTSCGDSNRNNAESEGAEYGMGVDPSASGGGVEGADVEYASNNAAQRNYDVNTMGTAAKNRRQMEATGKNLSDQDYQRLRQEYDQVNTQMRDSYRQSPGLSMRYTDDHQTADYSYDYYGVYYDNVNDNQTRNNFTQLEQRRMDLKNQMRGKIDKETGAYLAAEMDAVPKEGYDQLYNHLQSQLNGGQSTQAQNNQNQSAQASNAQGTVFVEFVVDKNGNVTNPKVVDVIEGQATAGNMSGAGTSTGTAGTTGTGTNTGTGTSGEGTTDNATNTGMSPNSTGTVGSGNTAGSEGTTTGTTGNSTASGNDGAQAGQSGQAASTQTTQNAQDQTRTGTNATTGTTGSQGANSETAKQLEQQALKAIKSTNGMWEPAQMNGQPVASLVQMPIPVGMENGGTSGQMNNSNMNTPTNTDGTNTNDRSNNGVPRNNNTGVEGGEGTEGGTNVNPGSGTQNGGRTSTGTVNTGSGTASGTTDTDGGR